MGERRATLSLKADGGMLTGSQMADGNTAEIFGGILNGNQLSWKVSISDPMPLTLEFNGTVDGDEVTGSVTLGNFCSSSFSGTGNLMSLGRLWCNRGKVPVRARTACSGLRQAREAFDTRDLPRVAYQR